MRLACAALSPRWPPQARACVAYAYTVEFRLPWKSLAIAALVATSAAATFWLCRGLRHDDAFITFVYARHLGAGEGFVFNLGERVLGATSPLHVLLLALVYRVAGDVLPTAAIALGAAAPLAARTHAVLDGAAILAGAGAAARPSRMGRTGRRPHLAGARDPICSWPWFWPLSGRTNWAAPCSAVSAWA